MTQRLFPRCVFLAAAGCVAGLILPSLGVPQVTEDQRANRSLASKAGAVSAPTAPDQPTVRSAVPPQIAAYAPFFVHYARHAESLWHPVASGGYWGDGQSDGNGGIRGTSNLTLAMAWLVVAYQEDWLSEHERASLAAVGLTRDQCLRRVQDSWRYLAACHHTGSGTAAADGKQWGRSWQSSLWVGASGLAALLTWEPLGADLQRQIRRVVVDEADAKLGVPPRDGQPGNTAAEENGWDTHAPAIALALFPDHPHATDWLRSAQRLAVNTYSAPADRAADTKVGEDAVKEVVSTTNLANDFTLSNHGFFHPSYVKVSGQELGEAWAMLAWGDRCHGTQFAQQFRPYALHHVADVWQRVMLPLLLPEGEFAFPAGQDWALHTGTGQSYFAFIAASLQDPRAALAERRGLEAARLQMQTSPDARIFGLGGFEWWWESILLKRYVTAMLHFLLATHIPPTAAPESLTDRDEYHCFPDAGIMLRRTPRYFTSLALRPTPTALIIPLGEQHLQHPYVTTPRTGSILPPGTIVDYAEHLDPGATAVVLSYSDGTQAAMVATGSTVLWLANRSLNPLAIQNDMLVTGRGRRLHSASGSQPVPPLTPLPPFQVDGTWLNIDGQFALVSPTGFEYRPAGALTRRSAAEDLITPLPSPGPSLLIAGPRYSADQSRDLAASLQVAPAERSIRFCDPITGKRVHVEIGLSPPVPAATPVGIRVQGQVGELSPLKNLTDNDPTTAVVLRNAAGTGPTREAPILLEFESPPEMPSPRRLQIVPRPGYGPRDITVERHARGQWYTVDTATLAHQPAQIALPDAAAPERIRLTIHSGWDRGTSDTPPPRNTQIAEISFHADIPRPAPSIPVRVRID